MPVLRTVIVVLACHAVSCQVFAEAAPALADTERNTLVVAGEPYHRPSAYPDRIALTITADPATSQTVNWRTRPGVEDARAQITAAAASPGLHLAARTIAASSASVMAGNGLALHHHVIFSGLEPDTLYAYRVSGAGTWSEWLQFRTARADAAEFAFLYFGDAQNSVKSHFSRVIREASSELPRPALMLHAGDLVSQREHANHDDEWGEWFEAGGFLHAMSPSLPVAGNHEYVDQVDEAGNEYYALPPAWRAHFRLPENGPPGLRDTVYASRYQGVLFVALDSTRALQDEADARTQAAWLDALLTENDRRWTIVSHHHPIFSVSMGRDNPILREHWQPLYEKHGVDLVLQGHDHTYGRGSNLAEGSNLQHGTAGTVYLVSVAGAKMYRVSESARADMARTGEDVQLYQLIRVGEDRIAVEARTAAGELYDAFDLLRDESGGKRLVNRIPAGMPTSGCSNPAPPRPTRCWNGTELVH